MILNQMSLALVTIMFQALSPKSVVQRDCPAKFASCGKCAEQNRTNECTSTVLKCVNCSGPHQSGHTACAEQVKAVDRYRAFLDKNA